jgi:hypothetical protein
MSNCPTFKILIDRFAGQRLSVTVDCSWARSGPQTSSPQARDNRRKFRAAPRILSSLPAFAPRHRSARRLQNFSTYTD